MRTGESVAVGAAVSIILKKKLNVRPHPGPLPRGEGELLAVRPRTQRSGLTNASRQKSQAAGDCIGTNGVSPNLDSHLPLLGERAEVRADVSIESHPPISDFILWQLADSAFPTGGFAHSAGLEAAWQHGEVRNRIELALFIEAGLQQLSHAALPFVTAAHDEPERLAEFDQLCDAFNTNHVTNRASRAQGRALLSAVERIFPERGQPCPHEPSASGELADKAVRAPFAHFAPVFGSVTRELVISKPTALRLFFFNQLRSVLAAAVRLNIVGPMAAQVLQHQFAAPIEVMLKRCEKFGFDDLAQTSPLLELWQGAQDRLYSRLFQS